MKNPGIKIPYLSIEHPVVTGTRCVEVRIPDHDDFMPVLASLMSIATRWFNYQRDPTKKGTELAKMWQNAYRETDWEVCMSCEDVADCIDNDPDTIQAVTNINQTSQGGQTPLSTSNQGANVLNGLDGCAYDNLYGAMRGLVQWLNANNEDFLDRIAAAATPAERAESLSSDIPGFTGGALGAALSTAVSFLSSALVNGYDANYSQPYADALACELFCLAQDTCSLSVDQLYVVLAARVGYVDTTEEFYNMILFGISGAWTGVQFADVMMLFQVGSFKFMGGFAGYVGINPLSNALAMGWDDPSDDWMLLCDCPDSWTYILDSASMPVWAEVPDPTIGSGVPGPGTIAGTVLTQTTTLLAGIDVTGITARITFPTIQIISGISIHQVAGTNIEGSGVVNAFVSYLDAGGLPIGTIPGGLPVLNGVWDFSYSDAIPGVKTIQIQYVFIGTTQTMEWNPIVISGRGVNPFV